MDVTILEQPMFARASSWSSSVRQYLQFVKSQEELYNSGEGL